MDPNACLSDLLEAIADDDEDLAREMASNLLSWLAGGGFAPGGDKLRRSSIINFCQKLAGQS
jgi:hypothetical protein